MPKTPEDWLVAAPIAGAFLWFIGATIYMNRDESFSHWAVWLGLISLFVLAAAPFFRTLGKL